MTDADAFVDAPAGGKPMRLRCIGCEVLARPLYLAAAMSPHVVDVDLLRRGLHDVPVDLRARLQEMVDESDPRTYDAVVLGYALCGQATAGLRAASLPLVVPRAHDCITLFLGDRERYTHEFTEHPGTFWYSQDYIERQDEPGGALVGLGVGAGTEDELKATHAEYVEKYGRDNADYLMEALGAWRSHYDRAAYIDLAVADGSAVEARARDDADRRGWRFERIAGDTILLRRLLAGDWDRDFLVVRPGERVAMSYDEDVVRAEPVE
jgi:hypothetical protein